MTNKSLRESVAHLMGIDPAQYPSTKMSYDLRRLRLKGLIERIPRSHAYRLTEQGLRTAIFFTKLHRHVFQPGLAALIPNQSLPSTLAQALSAVADEIQALIDKALVSTLHVPV